MRRAGRGALGPAGRGALGLAALAALLGGSGAADPGPIGSELAALLPDPPSGWERIADPVMPPEDPALAAQGLLASVAHHYTRVRGPVTEVCTVELWSFAGPAQGELAQRAIEPLGEWTRRAGPLLVIARARRLERQQGTSRELVPDCLALAESVHQRAASAP